MKIKAPRVMTSLLVSLLLLSRPSSSKNNKSNNNAITDLTKLSEILKNNILDTSYLVYAKEPANIREKASSDSKKIGLLVKGETLPLISITDNGWCKVKYDGSYAYIHSNNLDILESFEYTKKEIPWIYDINDFVKIRKMIITNAKVNVREEPNTSSKIYKLLDKDYYLPLVEEYNKKWLKVLYNGSYAYIYKKYCNITESYYIESSMKDMVYTTSKINLLDINTLKSISKIPKRESLKVYAENESYYLVEYNSLIGYVSKEHVASLGDNYVIIDISSQHLEVYQDDKLIIETPIVTGKDETPTYCGLFTVNDKQTDVYWPEFKVTVDYWMPFNRGEGMHDASWRSEFGSSIYEKKGSHGCVNLPSDITKEVYDSVEVDTPVLVKR